MKKVLLYSGGIDSWLIDKLWKPDVRLYVDIHGKYSKEEISRLPEDVVVIDFDLGKYELPNGFVPLRNLYFLMLASNYGDEICYGVVSGDQGSADKRMEFIDKSEDIMNYCLNGNTVFQDRSIVIERGFYNKTKYDLVQDYISSGGKIEDVMNETFSCYSPVDGHECWNCKPCYRKFLLGNYFGYRFPEDIERKVVEYMKKNVIPRNSNVNCTYFSERPGEGKYAEASMDKLFKRLNMNWRDFQ